MMRGYWPTLLDKEDADPEQRKHAHWVEQIPKLTFSRTLESSDWNNVQLLRDAGEMAALKQEEGAPMLIFGSPGLMQAFLALDADRRILDVPESRPAGRGHSLFRRARADPAEAGRGQSLSTTASSACITSKAEQEPMTARSVVHASFTITRHWKHAPGARVQRLCRPEAARTNGSAAGRAGQRSRRSFDFREGGAGTCWPARWKTAWCRASTASIATSCRRR